MNLGARTSTDPSRIRGARRAARGALRCVAALALAVAAGAASGGAARAQPTTLTLDPAQTEIRFRVPATLHTVRGTLELENGVLRFDREGGAADGAVVIDATSADTGNARRDRNLHADVLESDRHPRIVFRPERVEVKEVRGSEAEVRVVGEIQIHGGEHRLELPVHIRADGARAEIETAFDVPYVEWGMDDPSNFLLSVGKTVRVEVDAVGRLDPPPRPAAASDASQTGR